MEMNEPQQAGRFPGSCIYQLKDGKLQNGDFHWRFVSWYRTVSNLGTKNLKENGFRSGGCIHYWPLRRPDVLRESSLGGVLDPQFI